MLPFQTNLSLHTVYKKAAAITAAKPAPRAWGLLINPALPEFEGVEALPLELELSVGAVMGGAVLDAIGVVPNVSVIESVPVAVSVSVSVAVSVSVPVSVPVSVSVPVAPTPVDSIGGTCVRVGESESESDRDGSTEIGPGPVEGSPPGSETS
jgi:hypothetical protein